MKTLIVGHRGAMGTAPENTAVSFKKAIAEGADGIEFDVHLTKDGQPVVIHDEKINRTSDGKGMIKDLTLDELKKYDFGAFFGKEYSGERILTLAETLELTKKCQVINIEIKNGPIFYPGIEEKVLEIIQEFKLEDKVIISSFNHYTIHKVKKLQAEIKGGLLYMAGLYQPWEYARNVGADALHPYYFSITPEEIRHCHENGIKVNVFGVNDEDFIGGFIKAGADMLITDYPGRAFQILNK
ncbi:MAG TPA: glycerophosphodiester phosphodiesterase [Halanaerobiales bacterium]|nr:glycerophosphodiester phosphodiesterase [Halanaerobiales bacterium]